MSTTSNATSGRPNKADSVSPTTTAFGVSFAITSILSALIVLLKETNEGVHDFMAALSGHHWVTHGIVDVVLFLAIGFALKNTGTFRDLSASKLAMTVLGGVLIGGLLIFGFFVSIL